MIICYTVLQIWCMRAVIFIFHFGFWTIFDPFALLTAQKIKIKKKKTKRAPGDIILHMCTKNYDGS